MPTHFSEPVRALQHVPAILHLPQKSLLTGLLAFLRRKKSSGPQTPLPGQPCLVETTGGAQGARRQRTGKDAGPGHDLDTHRGSWPLTTTRAFRNFSFFFWI